MILNKGEAIFCNNEEEFVEFAQLLEDAGYEMYDGYYSPSITEMAKGADNKFGYRWMERKEFPECIATLTQDFVESIRERGELTCQGITASFTWRCFSGIHGLSIHVEDLL